jgi:hypothetical protein
MSTEIYRQWEFLGYSVAAGMCMAFVYDVIRLFRCLVRHGRLAVDIEDILYWLASFFAGFVFLYYLNNGVIRFAAVFGVAVGMAVYVFTVGRFLVKTGVWIAKHTLFYLFGKIRLTLVHFKHKIKTIHPTKDNGRKGEPRHGKEKQKKSKKKKTGVSPQQE